LKGLNSATAATGIHWQYTLFVVDCWWHVINISHTALPIQRTRLELDYIDVYVLYINSQSLSKQFWCCKRFPSFFSSLHNIGRSIKQIGKTVRSNPICLRTKTGSKQGDWSQIFVDQCNTDPWTTSYVQIDLSWIKSITLEEKYKNRSKLKSESATSPIAKTDSEVTYELVSIAKLCWKNDSFDGLCAH
jgi:hypothetical protein